MKALLSIKPEFAEKIFSGEKRFEFRKACFKENVRTVVVYVTMPVGKIIGEFDIETIIVDSPTNLWEETKKHAGISHSFFCAYFGKRDVAYAIKIKNAKKYKRAKDPYSLVLDFVPPQSFFYLRKEHHLALT